MPTKLIQGLQKLNFPQNEIERLAPLMDSYINELVLFNSAYNLVNTNDREEIAVRHILDSLSAVELIKALADERAAILSREAVSACPANPGQEAVSACPANPGQETAPGKPGLATIADIGSGGGLPGIPLAAALPQYNFVLVERMSKRCAFLENASAILGLRNVQVKNLELEKTPAASFDIATFRAFRPLDKKILKSLLAVLKPGGVLAAYKARRQKILEEMGALGYVEQAVTGDATFAPSAANDSRVYKTVALEVPFLTDTNSGDDRERNLVLIPKDSRA